jgi:predicted nuclease of predicted toxin-antitoxin system
MADENFPRHVVAVLRDSGFEVAWISEEAAGASGHDVLRICSTAGQILLTLDKGFGELGFAAQCRLIAASSFSGSDRKIRLKLRRSLERP